MKRQVEQDTEEKAREEAEKLISQADVDNPLVLRSLEVSHPWEVSTVTIPMTERIKHIYSARVMRTMELGEQGKKWFDDDVLSELDYLLWEETGKQIARHMGSIPDEYGVTVGWKIVVPAQFTERREL